MYKAVAMLCCPLVAFGSLTSLLRGLWLWDLSPPRSVGPSLSEWGTDTDTRTRAVPSGNSPPLGGVGTQACGTVRASTRAARVNTCTCISS